MKWLEERLELKKFNEKYLTKTFPSHPAYLLGEVALFSFITLVLTGIFLGFMYEPSVRLAPLFHAMAPAAYVSVVRLDLKPMGLLIRRIHHWSAMLMVSSIVLHLMRIYFTGAYRKPREINWLVGLALLGMALAASFTGYLLPYSQFSVTATSIAYYMVKSVPWVGSWLSRLIFAGTFPSKTTVPRFFFFHVMLIPVIIVALIGAHMVILVKQKHTEPRANASRPQAQGGKRLIGIPIWPEQAVISSSFLLCLLFTLALLATYVPINPIEIYGPPAPGTPVMRPDWYFLWVYGFLKLIPGGLSFTLFGGQFTPETIGGVLFPGAVFLLLALVPFLDRWKEPQNYNANPLDRPFMTAFGLAGGVFILMTAVAGFIDVLHITPQAMLWYTLAATAGVWIISLIALAATRKKG